MDTDVKIRFHRQDKQMPWQEPYITGYHFCKFVLPSFVAEGIISREDVLNCSVLSVDIPKLTLTEAFDSRGHSKFSLVHTNLIVKFLETDKLPIHKIITSWFHKVLEHDPDDVAFLGKVYYWTTMPDGKSLQYYTCLKNIYPISNGDHNFSADITVYDKLNYIAEFCYGISDTTEKVKKKILGFIKDMYEPFEGKPPWIPMDKDDTND